MLFCLMLHKSIYVNTVCIEFVTQTDDTHVLYCRFEGNVNIAVLVFT